MSSCGKCSSDSLFTVLESASFAMNEQSSLDDSLPWERGGLVRGHKTFIHVSFLLFLEIVESLNFFDISFPMYTLQTVILGTWRKMTRIKVIGTIY